MKKRILCYGDSNTWGYNAADGSRYDEDTRWPCRLQALLGEGYAVIEEGMNGRTTVWDDPVGERMAGITYLMPCMKSHRPFDLLIIMLGTNDLKSYINAQAGHIARSVGRLVDMARKSDFGPNGAPPRVLLVAPIHVRDCPQSEWMLGPGAVARSRGLSEGYRATAKLLGCHFMDAAEFAEPGPVDGVHLDAQGHAALARAMFDAVKRILD